MVRPVKRSRFGWPTVIVVLFVIAGTASIYTYQHHHTGRAAPLIAATGGTVKSAPKTVAAPAKQNYCLSNTGVQDAVIVSISKRHLWACDGSNQMYDSSVITGMENLPADLTPTGTYHIYAKQTDLTLKGSDSTGSWNDYVNYWMPFLSNQYGIYGFHDATWRKDSDFGTIDPYSSNASHGCVELPLATAKWLYGWAAVGTAVIIQA